ncbi:MAG: Permease of the drug/metabolite transporter (DMT) superfamily [Chloroflexi bacterium]|jgi:drug/metabolite transporter (DMT)-like permease|nr:MAG: Permease of the drug/metabolite transporter (DMT) superfamily [Chloroflexota bacterium]
MVVARVGLHKVPSSTGSLFSLAGGWVVVTIVAAIFYPKALFTLPAAAYFWLFLTGTLNFPIARFLNFNSMKILGVVRANPILANAPLISAFIAIVFLGEEWRWTIALGTLTTITGIVLVVSNDMGSRQQRAESQPEPVRGAATESRGILERHPILVGYGSAALAALAYGTIPPLGKYVTTNYANPLVASVYTFFFGTLVLAIFIANRVPADIRVSPPKPLLLVTLGGMLMSVGVIVLYYSLVKAPVVVVAPIFALNPLVTMLLVHIFLQRLERISPRLVLGTVLTVAGVAIITATAGG